MNKLLYYDISLEDSRTQNFPATKIEEISAASINWPTLNNSKRLNLFNMTYAYDFTRA